MYEVAGSKPAFSTKLTIKKKESSQRKMKKKGYASPIWK
jgi:hypothetical protein